MERWLMSACKKSTSSGCGPSDGDDSASTSNIDNTSNKSLVDKNLTSSSKESSNSDCENDEPVPIKKQKYKNYKQKFKQQWNTQFGNWCQQSDTNNTFCTVCNRTVTGGVTHISRHEKTKLHQNNLKKSERTPKISSFVQSDAQTTRERNAQRGEMMSVMFLHEHNLPFLLMDHLPRFIQAVCPDSQIAKDLKISRDKATLITKDCFAPEALQIISERINNSVGYSLMLDETTDVATKKTLVVVIRFIDDGKVTDHFFGLLEIDNGTALEIYNKTIRHLNNNNIPIKKMIGLAADNASVMMGHIKGVQALFKNDNASLFVMGCVCHSFHLCSSAAANKLPKSIEDFARGIYNYFKNSSNRLKVFKECQVFLNEKPHKLLRPSQTRWLSLQAVVNRILQHWNSLILVFQDAVLIENLHSVESILHNLRNPIYKMYFQFLSYILEIVNKLNLEFQSEKCKIHVLGSRINSLYKTVLRNFLKKDYVDKTPLKDIDPKNPRHFCEVDNVYFGANVHLILSSTAIDQNEVHNFKIRCLDFYIELCSQIKDRFSFDNPVWTYCSYFTPTIALSGEVISIAAQTIQHFPQLVTNIQALDFEWRLLADCEEIKSMKDLQFEEFWNTIFNLKNDIDVLMFPNLSHLVKGLLCIPHSSAAAERQFSQYNLIKTKIRNRLLVDTCDAILHAKDLLEKNTCYTWAPSNRLLQRKPNYRP